MLKAEEEVRFAIFTFTASSGIDDALLMAARVGCKVTGRSTPARPPRRGRRRAESWAGLMAIDTPA